MKLILTCGGTAGHINPALAVARRMRELTGDCEVLFIGAEGKMEMDLVPREGYDIKAIKITNLSRGKSLKAIKHNLATIKNVAVSIAEAKKIVRDFKPDAVIGTGGYVCYPVLMAARKLHIPTAVHESNAVPGLTTKLLADKVDAVMVGFEESRAHYRHSERITVTGTPVRGEFDMYTQNSAKSELGIPADMPLAVSVWGSLGAGHMNEVMTELIPMMKDKAGFKLIHSVGSMYYKNFMQNIPADHSKYGADVREYIYDMPRVLAAADVVMCRAGASTLAELAYMGKPAIIVPSPNVTGNHQEKNARVLERAGAAKVFLDKEVDAETLMAALREILGNDALQKEMSAAMASLSVHDATDKICSRILEIIK